MATKQAVENLRPGLKFRDKEQKKAVLMKLLEKGIKLNPWFQAQCEKLVNEK